jgi:hypothetical protein
MAWSNRDLLMEVLSGLYHEEHAQNFVTPVQLAKTVMRKAVATGLVRPTREGFQKHNGKFPATIMWEIVGLAAVHFPDLYNGPTQPASTPTTERSPPTSPNGHGPPTPPPDRCGHQRSRAYGPQ